MQAPGKLYYSIEPVPEGGAGLVLVEDQAAAEGELGTLWLGSVGQPQGEQLQTGGLEEEVPVLGGQLRDAGDAVAEGADDVNGGG